MQVKYQVQKERLQPSVAEATAAAAAAANPAADPAAEPTITEPAVWGGADHATLVDLAQSSFSGEGVRVAVVDDGLDYTHHAFGSCTAINSGGECRVVAGYDFTDDDVKTVSKCLGCQCCVVQVLLLVQAGRHASSSVQWHCSSM
jgi:subtilisin family serine protease